jgi:putative methionine-R-sulfoxide reductase with GAF domain
MAVPLGIDRRGIEMLDAQVDYDAITASIRALCAGETDIVALMATVVCEIHHHHPFADWTGFYRVVGPELLKIGPYQGGHGCLVIPFSRGVCGAAARTGPATLLCCRPRASGAAAQRARGAGSAGPGC